MSEQRGRNSELYFSVDVETDGPIPGDCNMVSLGASVCGQITRDNGWKRIDQGATFYRELRTDFDGDDNTRTWLAGQGFEINGPNAIYPYYAMSHFKAWIERTCDEYGARPVFVAYPLSFDWSFTHWYFEHYLGYRSDPFGFSSAFDIKTMFSVKARRGLLGSTKRNMPRSVKPAAAHTHNAVDDAIEQGQLFANLMNWKGN